MSQNTPEYNFVKNADAVQELGKQREQPFDQDPVCFQVLLLIKDKLKAVLDWQKRLREVVDEMILSVNDCQYKLMFVYVLGDLGHTLAR